MDDNFILTLSSLQNKLAVAEITSCNDFTSRFGLALSPTKAQELVETRAETLNRVSRGRQTVTKQHPKSAFVENFKVKQLL